ncbi:MAG: HAMP domain-containing protein, partial [Planctomycetaceae bacterium]|nr:HAMP domain-containing protein [Planctomycetaceae bacterium]
MYSGYWHGRIRRQLSKTHIPMSTDPLLPGLFNKSKRLFLTHYSLRFIFALIVGMPVLLLFGILIVQSYYTSRIEAAKVMREQMVNEVKTRAKTLNYYLAMMSRYPDQIALAITIRKPENVDTLLSFQYAMLAKNPIIYGNAVAWEPFLFDPTEKYVSPYVWRDLENNGAISNMLFTPDNGYDYLAGQWDWYDDPKKKYGGNTGSPSPLEFTGGMPEHAKLPRIERGLWSAPYFDEGGGNVLMCTYSAPFFVDRQFAGVVTCDVTTDWIREFLSEQAFEGNLFILISPDGSVISHPNAKLIMKRYDQQRLGIHDAEWENYINAIKTVFQSFQPDSSLNNEGIYRPELSSVLHAVKKTESYWTEGIQLPATGWVLICVVPQATVYGVANAHFQSTLLIFLCGLLLLSIYLYWQVDYCIISPLKRLAVATNAIAEGNFEYHIEPNFIVASEFRDLSYNFNRMTGTLRQSI